MPSEIHTYLPYFSKDGEIYADLFGSETSEPKGKILDINDLNQGAITNAIEWHFGVKRNAVKSLNIKEASGTFLDIWGDIFGINRPKGMVDELYKDYLLRSIFDFNPTIVGLDVLSKKYSFSYKSYDEMGVYLDKAFLDVGVTNLSEPNYLFSSVIVDETLKRSFFLSADSMSSFSDAFLQEIQVEKPSGVELYLSETSVFKYLSFPETFLEAFEKAENGVEGYNVSYVNYDIDSFSGILYDDEVTFHGILLVTPYGTFESKVTSINLKMYHEYYKNGELNTLFLAFRRTNEKHPDKDSFYCSLELYPISKYPIIEFNYPTTIDAFNKDINIVPLFMIQYLRDILGVDPFLYNVNPIVKKHGKKELVDEPVLVDVEWKYNFNELDNYLNPRVAFFDITAPIVHNARPTKIQNQFYNDGEIIFQPITIKAKEDGGHISRVVGLSLNIFEKNFYTNAKNSMGTAIAGVVFLKRTKMYYKEQFQMEMEVQPVIEYLDGSISSPLNGSISMDFDKFRIATFNKDFIDIIYYPDVNNGDIVFIDSFGSFPNYIKEGRNGYSISKIIIDAQAI